MPDTTATRLRARSLRHYAVSKPFPGFSVEVVIDERPRGGMIMVTGDLGNYGAQWTNVANPSFRSFLAGLNYDYFMLKAAEDQGYTFDAAATLAAVKQEALQLRRSRDIDAETARDIWTDLEPLKDAKTESDFVSGWTDLLQDNLGQSYEISIKQKRTSLGALFWAEAWPALCATWSAEVERESRAILPRLVRFFTSPPAPARMAARR